MCSLLVTATSTVHNHRIQIFDTGHNYVSTIGSVGQSKGQFRYPSGIDCSGALIYVADTANHRVQVFMNGVFQRQYGTTNLYGLEPDLFNQPTDVKVDNKGVLYFVDSDNNRIVRIYDLVVGAGEAQGIYPKNPSIDFGADDLPEWEYPSTFTDSIITPELKVRLNVAVQAGTPKVDQWGNYFVDIPIKVTSESQGVMTIDQIDIQYEHVTSMNITHQVKNIIDAAAPEQDEVPIPLHITAKAGKLRISNISVIYDMPPTLIGDIPDTYSIDEDSSDARLIDLHDYFKDDTDARVNLTFKIISSTNGSLVNISLRDGHFISADTYNGSTNDDWHGSITVNVSCTNTRGLTTLSNHFIIHVESVNDRPVFVSQPVLTATEEENYTYTAKAIDPDGDELTYELAFAPKGMFMDPYTGVITYVPTNSQVGEQAVEVRALDGDLLTGKGRQLFNITVLNVNDPPVIESDPVTTATVGVDYGYTVLVTDEDNDNLTMTLEKKPDGMKLDPATKTITWKPEARQAGTQKVKIGISDGTVTEYQEFEIEVESSGSTVMGLPLGTLLMALTLLIIVVIIVVVVVAVSRRKRRKAAAELEEGRSRRKGRRRPRDRGRRRRRREEEDEDRIVDEEEREPEASPKVGGRLWEDPEDAEPEECPKCGDLLEVGIGYCPSCGHIIKKEGEEEDIPATEELEEDTGPEPEAETEPDEGSEASPLPGPPVTEAEEKEEEVEEPEDQPDEETEKEEEEEEEEKPKDDPLEEKSLDDIMKALKD